MFFFDNAQKPGFPKKKLGVESCGVFEDLEESQGFDLPEYDMTQMLKTARNGGFLKWWHSTTIGFPTKNDYFGMFWGYRHFRKHPNEQKKALKSDNCYTHTNPSHDICCVFAVLKKLGSVRFMINLLNPSSIDEWYMVYNYLHLIHLLHWLVCRKYTTIVHDNTFIHWVVPLPSSGK